jgi:multiple sugar transport system substrate-binding protein
VTQLEQGVAVPRPQTPAYPTITSAFSTAFANIVQGADPRTELTNAAQTIDQDLQDNDFYPPPES